MTGCRYDDGTVSGVDFTQPINGQWSELVAFFDVVTVPGGVALALSDAYAAGGGRVVSRAAQRLRR